MPDNFQFVPCGAVKGGKPLRHRVLDVEPDLGMSQNGCQSLQIARPVGIPSHRCQYLAHLGAPEKVLFGRCKEIGDICLGSGEGSRKDEIEKTFVKERQPALFNEKLET